MYKCYSRDGTWPYKEVQAGLKMGVRSTTASELLSVAEGWLPVILPTSDSRCAWFPAHRELIWPPHSEGYDSAQLIMCRFSLTKNIYWANTKFILCSNCSPVYHSTGRNTCSLLSLEPLTEDKNIRHNEVKKLFRAIM